MEYNPLASVWICEKMKIRIVGKERKQHSNVGQAE
jgi:hypothetical protein